MSLAASFYSMAAELDHLEAAVRQVMMGGLLEVARVAVDDYIVPNWPRASGTSARAWGYRADPDGATILCATDYSSYVFAGGDKLRTPIYLDLVPWAVSQADLKVGVGAMLSDLTAEYFGQGRTTSHLTGTARKFIIHTPADQAAAWRANCPEMIETIEVFYRGELRRMEIVPSDRIAAGGGGQNIRIRTRR